MTEFERRYLAYGINGEAFENELAKIMNRYAKEGRSDRFAPMYPDSRKQVRFDEE